MRGGFCGSDAPLREMRMTPRMALRRLMIVRSSARSCTSTVIVMVERPLSTSRAVSVRTLALSVLSAVATSMTRPERCALSIMSVVL